MKAQHFVDEAVLADLLKNDTSNVTWKTMFQHYREPFLRYFESQGYCPEKGQPLFREMFALLVTGIRENLLKAPFDHTLFEYLVVLGEKYMVGKPELSEEGPMKLPAQFRHPFLAGEVLLTLLSTSHEAAINAVHKHYQRPVFAMLKSKYRLEEELLNDNYGESIAILLNNILKGKLVAPMEARLYTYFFRVIRNRCLEQVKIQNRLPSCPGTAEDIEKKLSQIPQEEPEPELEEKFPIPYKTWQSIASMLKPEDDLFERLIASLNPEYQVVLRLHFVDGLKHKDIGNRLGISEVCARKRLFDGVKKLRKHFASKS